MYSNGKQWKFKLIEIDNQIDIELIENSIESFDKTIINRFDILERNTKDSKNNVFGFKGPFNCLIKYKVLLIQN